MKIGCILLAAGKSSRMGQSKIVLPWGRSTVISTILNAYLLAKVNEIVVVTGGYKEHVEKEISHFPVKIAFNHDFENGEMADSVKTGLKQLTPDCSAVFIALGDQPKISVQDLIGMIELNLSYPDALIIPSYAMRRGHPWLVPQYMFQELAEMNSPRTLRDFINAHEKEILYYLVKESDILTDLDTPEDYLRHKPE
ncbi:MAG: nucleotidyltransferase family protein [Anaerolineaceae bacterium]|nr:nucleotidyltransferase family protein [Anaerolineaceae bacterium]